VRENLHLAYRKGDIYAVIQHYFGAVSPDIVEQVEHDTDGFVPYQPSIPLGIALIERRLRQPITYLRESWSGDRSVPLPFLPF